MSKRSTTEAEADSPVPPAVSTSRWRRGFGKAFNYAHNPLSIAGIVLATVSALSILAFGVVELAGGLRNPYLGIFAYFVLPAIFVVGLVLLPLGMLLRRRRLRRAGLGEDERARYPRLDFNDPQLRRAATVTLGLSAINALILASSSFFALEYMESVEFCGQACHTPMEPQYVAYQRSPHSEIACVECHVAPGISPFVQSKLRGLGQLWHLANDSYQRPIRSHPDAVSARDTCDGCHSPRAYHGEQIRTLARFAEDEANTPAYSVLLLPTGGGSLEGGPHGGIHWWHNHGDNRMRYVAEGEKILWVELTSHDGEVRVYSRPGEESLPGREIAASARVVGCLDCHNRPAHRFTPPSTGLDAVLESRPEIAGLPFYKQQAVELVESEYASRQQGMSRVRDGLLDYYRRQHPPVWDEHRQLVEAAADAAAGIYGGSVFPAMKTDWRTYPEHIGHEQSPGCFRCHDEELATADGEHVITMDCETCHTFLVEDASTPPDLAQLTSG